VTRDVVGITATPDGKGYWEVTSTGHVYNFGDTPAVAPAGTPEPLPFPVTWTVMVPPGPRVLPELGSFEPARVSVIRYGVTDVWVLPETVAAEAGWRDGATTTTATSAVQMVTERTTKPIRRTCPL
jgi:hypothetical protein